MNTTNTAKVELSVTVDRFNKIIALSDNWLQVAEQGHAEVSLQQDKVIGKELDQFISNDTTRMYIDSCLKLCRLRKQTIYREYRCDSPTHKRFMELELTPLAEGVVVMKHTLTWEEPFEQRVDIKEAASINLSPQYIRCSMCNRLKQPQSDNWVKPEVLKPQHPLAVIYSVCPECMNTLWQTRGKPQ